MFGPGTSARDVTKALDADAARRANIVTGAGDVAEFQELIDADRLFYLSRGELSERDLAALTAGVAAQRHVSLDRFLSADTLRRLALAQSVAQLAGALRAAAAGAVHPGRVRCVLFDRERQVLWIPNESDGQSAAVGLVSFIVRTGVTLCLARIGDDPRFDRDFDGDASDRLLGVPVRAGRGEVVAVLVISRSAGERPFEPIDVAALEAVAAHASPYAAAWLVEEDAESPFRQRALRELDLPDSGGPEPLRLDSQWVRRASWFAIVTLATAVAALILVWGMRIG